jgi:hypothetical protein
VAAASGSAAAFVERPEREVMTSACTMRPTAQVHAGKELTVIELSDGFGSPVKPGRFMNVRQGEKIIEKL